METQFGTYDNNRPTRIIDTLAKQVLTETAGLAFEHVTEGLQRTAILAGNGATAATVIEQRIDRFLKHAFLVADDHVRRAQLHETFQPVVKVNHAAVKIV